MGERADSEVAAKLVRARESYQEVLDATKHQDDKINRVLVGIAFLTTGAIAFLFRTDVIATTWRFGSHQVPFVKLMAGCYAALTVAAVILLLLSLSSELRLPSGKPQEPLSGSFLYFTMIAGRTEPSWVRGWRRSAADIDERLLEQYQRETYNIALRARLKYGRTDEAAALFILALMFLAAGFLLALTAVSQVPAATVRYTWVTALLLGGVFAVHALLQLSTLHRFEQQNVRLVWRIRRQDRQDVRAWMDKRRRDGMRWLLAAVVVYVVGVALLGVATDGPVRVLLAVLCVVAAVVGYTGTAPRWQPDDADRVRLSPRGRSGARPYALAAGTAGLLAVLSWAIHEPWLPLAAAAAVPLLLSTVTVGRQLTVARRVAALADPGRSDAKSYIDDQLLPETAPPPGSQPENVGAPGQNVPEVSGDGEAAAVATRVRSAEEVVTGMLGHTPAPGSVVYVSQPITTGPVYVGLRRSCTLDETCLKVAAKRANRDGTRALMARVREAFAGQDVLDPSDYEEDGLDQHGYHSLWTEVIRAYGRVVVLADGWELSVGCSVELQTALDCGLDVLDAALAPLPPTTAAALLAAAVPELEAADIDVTPVRRALDTARSAS